MIVEFIGASGSGKTALMKQVAPLLGTAEDVAIASDLVLGRLHMSGVGAPTARNLLADVSAAVEMLRVKREHRALLGYALRRLGRQRPVSWHTVNYVRSVVRRLGVDEIARRRGRRMVVLTDEGIVLAAYLLFVYGNVRFDETDLAQFADLVPMPDRIVHVKAPLETLVDRTMSRPDPPRELRTRNHQTLSHYLGSAAELFARLVALPVMRDRVFEVENNGDTPGELNELAAEVASSIGAAPYRGNPATRGGTAAPDQEK